VPVSTPFGDRVLEERIDGVQVRACEVYIYLSSSGISLCFSGVVHFDSFVAHRVFIHRFCDLHLGSERAMGLFLVRFWKLARRHAYHRRLVFVFVKDGGEERWRVSSPRGCLL
jgi:hypothetical protein